MNECNSCGAEVLDQKQIVCLSCGAVASQPVIENVASETVISAGRARTQHSLLRLLPESGGVYGRGEFLKGSVFLWIASALGMVAAAALMQANEAVGAITLVVMCLWVLVQNIALLTGRLYDLGCRSLWSRVLGVATLFVPIVSLVTLVLLVFAPRDALQRGKSQGSTMHPRAVSFSGC